MQYLPVLVGPARQRALDLDPGFLTAGLTCCVQSLPGQQVQRLALQARQIDQRLRETCGRRMLDRLGRQLLQG
ncbi:hypothetical protein [Streptomyces sp. A30]|uniref:hypothetical protein n=1 Tax=Streptomyces sp. A30 TaxID=2789273 RepID=UPI0039809649